jgi:peptidoglycan/xylan/chitin deacetylase (PgdA/CDA1 family)
MSSLKHRLFAAGFAATAALKADRWLRPLAQGCGAILMLHHVRPWRGRAFAPNRLLEITPQFLDRTLAVAKALGFDLVPLDEVPSRLVRPGRPFAAVTFDDGYRDTAEHALPVLRRHGAPFTVFVAADFADGTGRLWWVELEEAIARLDRVAVTVGGVRFSAPCGTPPEKAAAFDGLYRLVRSGPEEHLRTTVALLVEEAGLDPAAITKRLCLGWDEIDALAREPGATIGAHTLSHPMLAKWPTAFARREIVESKAIIEGKLGRPVRHFAYPVGDPASAGPREFALAREAGFSTAVTTRPGHLFPGHRAHLHALPRVSVNGLHQSENTLRALLSGVPFLAWNRGRRLNVA